MTQIDQVHHDGLGLNDLCTVVEAEDEPGRYNFYRKRPDVGDELLVGYVQFQTGHLDAEGSRAGILDDALITLMLHRLEGWQAGTMRCRENALVITKLQEALHWKRHRAEERRRRGVLGTDGK